MCMMFFAFNMIVGNIMHNIVNSTIHCYGSIYCYGPILSRWQGPNYDVWSFCLQLDRCMFFRYECWYCYPKEVKEKLEHVSWEGRKVNTQHCPLLRMAYVTSLNLIRILIFHESYLNHVMLEYHEFNCIKISS